MTLDKGLSKWYHGQVAECLCGVFTQPIGGVAIVCSNIKCTPPVFKEGK